MKISIVTVAFNAESTIRDTIESVLLQDYPEVEYIVIDGASGDGTARIVQSYRDRIQRFVSEPDAGIYDAMNKGVALATGDVVGLLNADDWYSAPEVLSEVATRFQQPETDAVYGDLKYVSHEDPTKATRYWKAGKYQPGLFLWGWMPPHPTFFIRREFYQKYGGFRLDMGTAADYELMLRMVHKHEAKLAYVQKVLVTMRAGGVSNHSLKNRLLANKNDRRAWIVNGLRPNVITTTLKPFRKILQFIT